MKSNALASVAEHPCSPAGCGSSAIRSLRSLNSSASTTASSSPAAPVVHRKALGVPAKASVASSSAQWRQQDETLMIFDFDDTLFPTTWVAQNRLKAMSRLPPCVPAMLAAQEQVVRKLLTAAKMLGDVVIVTNASVGWVGNCIQRFMPSLLPLFDSLKVYYARECFMQAQPQRAKRDFRTLSDAEFTALMAAWKVEAMMASLEDFYGGQRSWKNIVSIGDSLDEERAVREVTRSHSNATSSRTGLPKKCRAKTMKLADGPTIQLMHLQTEFICRHLPTIVNCDQDCRLPVVFRPSLIRSLHLDEMDVRAWGSGKATSWMREFERAAASNPTALMDQATMAALSQAEAAGCASRRTTLDEMYAVVVGTDKPASVVENTPEVVRPGRCLSPAGRSGRATGGRSPAPGASGLRTRVPAAGASRVNSRGAVGPRRAEGTRPAAGAGFLLPTL
mmetsp:Transcript_40323/g.96734  ORF Transcript_40323/g.96734 Transcript_40323/m.96734 type:complete len:449 (+) Transcript_40323:58-1404(+)